MCCPILFLNCLLIYCYTALQYQRKLDNICGCGFLFMLLEKILIFVFLNFSYNNHLFLLLKFFITENVLHLIS